MNKNTAHTLWFNQIRKNDIALVGGKGANLGEMYHAEIPVPNGFVVTAKAYFDFLKKTSLKDKILTELSGLNVEDSNKLIEASKHIKTAIMSAAMPEDIQQEIKKSYHELCGEFDKRVAVRSSATAEDLPDASFAGQQETYLNVEGYKDVIKHVQMCWASLFESRAIFYRTDKNYDHLKVGIAVPVQLMVQSEISGIMFTVNPLTNSRKEVSIEAAFGLGQPIVSGELTPDQFLIDKKTNKITYRHIAKQTWQFTLAGKTPVSKAYQEKQKLSDKYVKELAQLGMRIEDHYGRPQDIEWALEGKKLFIVQSRPVTTLNDVKADSLHSHVDEKKAGKFILEGLAASPGVASGPVVIVRSPKEISRVKEGDILVAVMTDPDYVPAMKRASAIVTDEGGRTSHAAIVSRELGIPAVVGSEHATKILKQGEVVTVDGSTGKVFEGDFVVKEEVKSEAKADFKTATKIYVNLAEPELAEDMAARNVDGVGLLRAEFIVAQIGKHPRKFIEDGKQDEFVIKLAEGMGKFAKAFHPRPVVYRATDFRTNEFRNLVGGAKYEKDERNPMIGFRGASRYLEDDDVFRLEIEAMKIVRNKQGLKNLHMMIPFVRTVDQLVGVKKIMSANGLRRSGSFMIWMMVEIPSNVILLEDFLNEGIDGVSIGTNDLTMLILGVDRDNPKVANVYNELDPAVMAALEKVVTVSKKMKVTCSMCGQAPSQYPELVEKLVEWGITSVSLSPDVVEKTRKIVYEAEKKLLAKKHSQKSVSKEAKRKRFTI
ncbi:phosphoenolpyruvate synthase [Candidatus Nomurabacteria bacterium]|uniref:Phosphoenolpyruvate synthase n=1 Tax=candidate division WWE3 bacterium TaxID=2053526 RepID=A0A955DZA9_UNCKA|nr:phosphoenolpyruvate synthase [candidate division WWE3 bacterium]MCB9824111.1 phosphoenolpyruvate synthase [Candidatus Nomurabacteria bacterium]MCB9826918.1 phosphoenolpyruvate synthase [Candidatus Nomurabacteria bacterium]MCB9828052.1 phosphoenolpyruvate synthase [Candidatus Nomurabacteria bacterium]HXK52782.1 phosphoenolpyruvate synthase [bacterium]